MKNTIDTVYSRCAQLSRTGVGVLVASVMVLLMTVVSLPGLSVADPHTDKDAVRVAQQALPVVESPVGHQSQITAGDNTIAVPTDHAKDSSALIRVTIMPDKDIVLSSGDSPFLTSSAVGEPVSAVTFLPITEGKVSFSSTVDAQARVEVLATFNEDKYQAGTVVLADKPVTIVDSHNDLGMPQLTATPTRVVANGLVSPKGTGFILARVTANLSSAGDVTISGQQLAMPKDMVSTTAILGVNDHDEIEISASTNGTLRVDVIGYLSVGLQLSEKDAAEKKGSSKSAVVGLKQTKAESISLQPGKAAPVTLPEDAQGTMVFTMLGTDTPAGAPAAIAGNYDPQDRSTGVAVNTGTGTVPQLAVLDGATPQVLSHQAMTVNALPVAYVQNKAEDAEEAPEIAIVSPKSGESPDIERGVWSVEGTFKAPAQVERIEIYVNGNLLSDKADIVLEGNGGTWKHDVVPDKSQSISLEVKLVDAAGNVASASWSGDITVPADDEVVVSPETVVLDAADLVGVTSPNPGMAVSNKQPRYHLGDIIVSGATDELPDGLLGQVIAVVYEEGQYKTILRPVTLGNVILQGEVDLMIGRNDAGEITSAPFDDTEFAQEKDMEEELAKDGNTSDSPSDSDSGDSITTDSSDDGTSTQAGGAFFGTSRGMTGMTVSQPTHLANQVFNAIAGSKHAEKTVSPAHKVVKTDVKEKFSDIPLLYYSCAKDTKKSSKKSMDKGDFTIDAQANFSLKKSECEAGLNIHVKYRSVYKPPSFGAVGDWILSKADRLKDIVDTGYSVIEGDWSLSISAVAWSNFTMDMDISGKVSVKLSDDAKKRLTKELASKNYTFNIGPVPVVINLRATVGPILQFNFEAKVNLHAEYHVWIERGFRIRSNGKLEKISHTPEPKKAFAVKGEVNMDASIGLEIKPEVSIYGLLNFAMPLDTTVDAEAKASEKVDVDLTKPLTFESLKKKKEFTTKGDLVIQLNAEIGVTIDIGRIIKPLLNQQIRDLLSPILNKSITLLEKTVPIAKTAIPLWKFPTKKDKDSQEKPTDPSHEDPEQTEDEKDAAAKKLVDEKCSFSGPTDYIPYRIARCTELPLDAISARGLSQHPDLNSLTIRETPTIDAGNFHPRLPNLQYLEFSYLGQGNNDDGITVFPDLKHTPNLEEIRIQYIHLRTLPDFTNLPNLKKLKLEGNDLTAVPHFTHMESLEELDLSSNEISTFEADALQLPSLKILRLDHNDLPQLPDIVGIPSLEELSTVQSGLKVFPTLTHLPNLKILSLSYNNLTEAKDTLDLPRLEALWIDNTAISHVPDFSKLPLLKWLELSNNKYLTAVPVLTKLPNLEELNIEDANLSEFHDNLDLPKLESLDLEFNHFSIVDNPTKLPNLKYLYIGDIETHQIPDFRYLPKLELLDLRVWGNDDDNYMDIMTDFKLPKLKMLLAGGSVRELPDFQGMPHLEELHAEGVELERVPDFTNLRSLETLKLSNNKLSTIPDFQYLDSLTYLNIEDNDFTEKQYFTHFDPDKVTIKQSY